MPFVFNQRYQIPKEMFIFTKLRSGAILKEIVFINVDYAFVLRVIVTE